MRSLLNLSFQPEETVDLWLPVERPSKRVRNCKFIFLFPSQIMCYKGVQWLSGRVLDSSSRDRGFEPHRRHCGVRGPRARHIYHSLVLVQPRMTRPCLTERLSMGRTESNQTSNIILLCCECSKEPSQCCRFF